MHYQAILEKTHSDRAVERLFKMPLQTSKLLQNRPTYRSPVRILKSQKYRRENAHTPIEMHFLVNIARRCILEICQGW